jgi:tetratricopeptide (TPR) repeat protein
MDMVFYSTTGHGYNEVMGKKILVILLLLSPFGFQPSALVCTSQSSQTKVVAGPGWQANSLSGIPFPAPEIPEKEKTQLEQNLSKAKAELAKNPNSVDSIIWVGRRTAYLGLYREAIAIYSEGIQKFPDEPKLYRHRGHRYLTIREIDKAIADLEKATQLIQGKKDEIEPDGIPNAKNIPTSTLNFNIWYHLGLAYYIKGDFTNALRAYKECMNFSTNDDMLVATSYWTYLTFMQQLKTDEARSTLRPISKDMDIIEDFEYRDLCLMFLGEIEPESLFDPKSADDLKNTTLGYGVGMYYLTKGYSQKAESVFCKIISGEQWPAFGYLATEAELLRMKDK